MFKKWGRWIGAAALILVAGLAVADTSTTNLLLTNQTTGANPNTWGDIADTNFETIDNKFGDVQAISTTGGTTTLTSTQEIVNALNVTGTLSSNATLEFSGRGGSWLIRNGTTGSFTVTAKVVGQTGVEIPQGTTKLVYCCISSDIASTTTPAAKGAGEVFSTAGATCPDDSITTYGQAISRTTYADLFAVIGTTYGTGDGSTTFNVPDLRGRTVFGDDDMGGSSANRLTAATADTMNGDTLGATGGVETQTIAEAELPSHTHGAGTFSASHTHSFSATSGSNGSHSHTIAQRNTAESEGVSSGGDSAADDDNTTGTTSSDGAHTHSVSGTTGSTAPTISGASASTGSGTALGVVPPGIVLTYCIYTGV